MIVAPPWWWYTKPTFTSCLLPAIHPSYSLMTPCLTYSTMASLIFSMRVRERERVMDELAIGYTRDDTKTNDFFTRPNIHSTMKYLCTINGEANTVPLFVTSPTWVQIIVKCMNESYHSLLLIRLYRFAIHPSIRPYFNLFRDPWAGQCGVGGTYGRVPGGGVFQRVGREGVASPSVFTQRLPHRPHPQISYSQCCTRVREKKRFKCLLDMQNEDR